MSCSIAIFLFKDLRMTCVRSRNSVDIFNLIRLPHCPRIEYIKSHINVYIYIYTMVVDKRFSFTEAISTNDR